MAPSYVVRALSPSEAADGARLWNDLADGTLEAVATWQCDPTFAISCRQLLFRN